MSVPPAAGEGERGVLICDDSAPMRSLLRAIVGEGLGIEVIGEAANGDEAVAEAERLQPDLILLDLAMPIRSGLDALPDLRRVAPDARVIVFSGFSGATVAAEVLGLGATSYLEKGVHPEAIVAAIRSALSPPLSIIESG